LVVSKGEEDEISSFIVGFARLSIKVDCKSSQQLLSLSCFIPFPSFSSNEKYFLRSKGQFLQDFALRFFCSKAFSAKK